MNHLTSGPPLVVRAAFAALALALVGCGDQVTILECPLGTMPEGATCVPWQPDAGPTEPDGTPESDPDVPVVDSDTPLFPKADMGQPDVPAEVEEISAPDVPTDPGPVADTSPLGGLGAPCSKHGDCEGGTCLDWPDGYCTVLDCDALNPCPVGGLCVPLVGGNRVCLVPCSGAVPCPGPNQGCKALSQDDGATFTSVCYGVDPDGVGPGQACDDHTECLEAATCLPSMPGGYCAVQGCSASTCDEGTVCISYGGIPTCLLECAVDEDCGGEEGAERRCGLLKSLAGVVAGACISGASGAQVGEQCLNDFECATGTCLVLGEGQCSQTGAPCFEASGGIDCQATEFCLINGENGVGSCTQPCSLGALCPGASLCEGQPGPIEGWCRAPCGGPGQDEACRVETGFTCTFGYPIGETSGQGRYLCMRPRPGSIGSVCESDEGCEANSCVPTGDPPEPDPEGDPPPEPLPGLCSTVCGDSLYCPFPTICVAGGAQGTCEPACLSLADCPGGLSCAPQPGGLSGTCK
jgi:hypothetical protein